MDFIILIISGAAIGLFSSFFGIGGGALIVPVLYSLFIGINDTIVISTSLATVFLITSINSFNFYKFKLLPPTKLIYVLIIGTFVGGLLGSQLTYLVDTQISKKIIAITLILIVVKNLFFKPQIILETQKTHGTLYFITGFLGALVSSITGLGGGVIFVPMFLSLVKVPARLVSPYSNITMVFATFMGTLPHLFTVNKVPMILGKSLEPFFIGQVNIAIVLLLGASAFFTSKLGVKFNTKVPEETKKILLAVLLISLSIKMFFL